MAEQNRVWRIGLSGAGWATTYHIPAWAREQARAQIVAIADPNSEARDRQVAAFGIPGFYPSVEAMLDAEQIDILDICSPREAHTPQIRLAVDRGLAVICQKPMAACLAEAQALVAALDPAARVMIHDNWRFRDTYRRIKTLLTGIGSLRRVQLDYLSSGMIPDATGARPALVRQPNFATMERLLVMEVLIHHLDTLTFLLGDLELVRSAISRSNDAIIGEDSATISLRRRSDGLPVELVGNLAVHGEPPQARDQLRIFGANGTITLDAWSLRCSGALTHDEQFDGDAVYRGSYSAAIGHFLDCLETGVPFEITPASHLSIIAIAEAVYAASQPGAGAL